MSTIKVSYEINLDALPFAAVGSWDSETMTVTADVEESVLRLSVENARHYIHPLNKAGSLATLLAVLSLATVEDAANAVDLTPQQLIDEAEAWQAMKDTP